MLGSDVHIGDDLVFLGKPHRITDIAPYPGRPGWRLAWARLPGQVLTRANSDVIWGITLGPEAGYYEVTR
jgi:hypothetical protein